MTMTTDPVVEAVKPADLYRNTLYAVGQILKMTDTEDSWKYAQATNTLLFKRVDFFRRQLLNKLGPTVQSGPFTGMKFHTKAVEGCYIPKHLGIYEAELHPVITSWKTAGYTRIVNIGCAEGYYAVGLALMLPDAEVLAYDSNPKAVEACQELARMNGVADRVRVYGTLTRKDWPVVIAERTLIICDCEGAEYELLAPHGDAAGPLTRADILVELHGIDVAPEKAESLLHDYQPTHDIRTIHHGGRDPNQFPALRNYKHLDQLLCTWEFRGGPTPWAFLKVRHEF